MIPNEIEIVLRIVLAIIFGGLIGLERESVNKSAGFRTHILVCVGSALIMLVSIDVYQQFQGKANIDPGRIAAQVVSGIGFLGAGTIMREGISVRGLTTAATLWAVAAVGLAVGIGYYFGAVISTGVIFLTLVYLGKVERNVAGSEPMITIKISTENHPGQLNKISEQLAEFHVKIKHIELKEVQKEGILSAELKIQIPNLMGLPDIMQNLVSIDGVNHVETTK
jgi:putative Mg2+ transporter-C (MgtC) family protein